MYFSDNRKISNVSSKKKKRRLSPENGSHVVTLTQSTTERKSKVRETPDISTAFYLTVRVANSSLNRKHYRLMLDCLLYEVVTEGIGINQYLMLEHLLSVLLGSKTDPLALSNENERRVSTLAQICMRDLRGKDFSGSSEEKVFISKETIETLVSNDLLMSKRTYGSRKVYWSPEKFLSIRSVSVETIIERSGNSERYSSYCKGYGESHQSAHNQKTKPSFELDGGDFKDPIDFSLKEIQRLLILTQLDVRLKYRAKKA